MPLRTPLLLTCAVVAVTLAVRSQASQAPAAVQPSSATPFDVLRPADLKPVPSSPRRKADPAPLAASPFALDAPRPALPPAGKEDAPRADAIDLGPLRYFAAQNDLGRVSAEIRLLRAKHPDWEPPEDLFSQVGSEVDERALWDLLSRRDFTGIRASMDEIRRDKPNWQPTADLASKLAQAESHDALVKASDAHRWDGVIEAATVTPSLLTCSDVDALWRTAEALARTGDEARATSAYRYVLSNCTPDTLRFATVQKASLVLSSPENLDSLIQMGRRSADGRGEFDQVRLDLLRRKIGVATADVAAPQPTAEEVAAVTASAGGLSGQADAQLLGWYARSRKDYAAAERWFRAALASGPSAKAAEGLVLALRDGGNAAEARRLAFQYAGLDPLNRRLMVEIGAAALSDIKASPLDHNEMATLIQGTEELKSSDGAQALGWHLYKGSDLIGAENWFRKSADWGTNEAAAVGLVVVARRLHHDHDYAARIAEYRSTYPRIAELETLMRSRPSPHLPDKAVAQARRTTGKVVTVARAAAHKGGSADGGWDRSADDIIKVYNAGQYDTAVALLEQRRQKHAEPRGLSVIRGWAMYHNGNWEGAKQVFSGLDGGGYSRERQEGLRVIQDGYTNPRFR